MCSIGCAKILLFTCNVLFFAGGAVLLSFGIAGLANPVGLGVFLSSIPGVHSMATVVNISQLILSASIFMTVLGSIMLLFGFLGCAGACFMLKPLLFLYWLLLGGVILAEIALIIYAAVNPLVAASQVQKIMYSSLTKNFDTVTINAANKTLSYPDNIIAFSWVSMQFQVPCCGAYNYTDYSTFPWNNTFTVDGAIIKAQVPPSCCATNLKSVIPTSTTDFVNLQGCLQLQSSYNQQGCYMAVTDLANKYMYVPIGICCGVIVIEVFCLIAAIYLWRAHPDIEKMA